MKQLVHSALNKYEICICKLKYPFRSMMAIPSMKKTFYEFGGYLKEKRELASLSLREVSIELGYSSTQFISNFENGTALPPLNKLKILVKLYKIQKSEVFHLTYSIKKKLSNNH